MESKRVFFVAQLFVWFIEILMFQRDGSETTMACHVFVRLVSSSQAVQSKETAFKMDSSSLGTS